VLLENLPDNRWKYVSTNSIDPIKNMWDKELYGGPIILDERQQKIINKIQPNPIFNNLNKLIIQIKKSKKRKISYFEFHNLLVQELPEKNVAIYVDIWFLQTKLQNPLHYNGLKRIEEDIKNLGKQSTKSLKLNFTDISPNIDGYARLVSYLVPFSNQTKSYNPMIKQGNQVYIIQEGQFEHGHLNGFGRHVNFVSNYANVGYFNGSHPYNTNK